MEGGTDVVKLRRRVHIGTLRFAQEGGRRFA